MRRCAPVHIIMYHPKTEDGKLELARRVAEVHSDSVNQRIRQLTCPTRQKLALLEAIIEAAKKNSRMQT